MTTFPSEVSKVPNAYLANEAILDLFMERAVDLLRLEAGTRNKVFPLLNQLEKDITAAIAQIGPAESANAKVQQNRLIQLQASVELAIQGSYRSVNTLMGKEVRNVADAELTWTASAINVATQATFADGILTPTILTALVADTLIQGAPTSDWWGRQAQGLSNRFADEMRRGIAIGESNSQLIDRVVGKSGQPGLMDIARSSAERLVRSSVQTVANAARQATYDQNSDLIQALQWHATLDTRTSVYCLTRDGHQYKPTSDHAAIDDGPPWLEGPGALHWCCRSTSIPILKSWRDLGIDADDIPHKTRASMDGQVPADTTFGTWLQKQSEARQNTVLGQGKAALWRSGKITLRDLLNQNGRPLTTEQLREKYANN